MVWFQSPALKLDKNLFNPELRHSLDLVVEDLSSVFSPVCLNIFPELVDRDINNIVLGDPALFECLDDRQSPDRPHRIPVHLA
jgi:hypothetical protein